MTQYTYKVVGVGTFNKGKIREITTEVKLDVGDQFQYYGYGYFEVLEEIAVESEDTPRTYLLGGASKENQNKFTKVDSAAPLSIGKTIRCNGLVWTVIGEMPNYDV